jgi:hypothetical protein
VKKARAVGKDFFTAIEMSVGVAGRGIAFAAEVFNLCDHLSQDPDTEVGLYIDEMQTVVQQAHSEAEATYKQFSVVRSHLLQVWVVQCTISVEAIDGGHKQIHRGNSAQEKRPETEQDPIDALKALVDDVCKLVLCVAKFALWWQQTATMISSSKHHVSINGRKMSSMRVTLVKKSWEAVQINYEVYSRTVSNL